jgi:multiple sugar transport system substrate-binding protein
MTKNKPLLPFAVAFLTALTVYAEKLVINSNQSNPSTKASYTKVVDDFKKQNPDLEVVFNTTDHEGYKTAIRNWLTTEPPDIVFWFSGNRMKAFVDRGLFDDVSDLWQKNNWNQDFSTTLSAMTVDGKQWGIPTVYSFWGVFYRKDIFEKLGIAVPKTWEEFVAVAKKLKENNIIPFTIGTKDVWTPAGWFDIINMRINGYDFHIELMDGKVPYTDQRVKDVFAKWRELVDGKFYLPNNSTYTWQESLSFLVNGKAAMILIGSFLGQALPADMKDKIGFFSFPTIKPDVQRGEDAPVDSMHIPAKAKNKAGARRFLEYIAKPEVQEELAVGLASLPANVNSKAPADPLNQEGLELLKTAKSAQYYDRDTDPEMATEGMKGFQEFMAFPDRTDQILTRLDKVEQRIFKDKKPAAKQ